MILGSVIDSFVVDLSRLQFALTAMYHFLFVPLTLGLIVIIAIMESIYVKTGKEVYKDMTRFWGKLFGINFALGVTTGLTMEFQFGTNWSYYSHFVGDIFGAPLAIEGLMAFFLESTLVGLFFFGWDRMGRKTHLAVTWLTAIGTNLSALWILVANGWMQFPTGSKFIPETMRHETQDFLQVVLSPVAQNKFLHTVSAGYTTGAIFVIAISAFYLLKRRDVDFARRSFSVAAVFGLFAALSVIFFGHESGREASIYQPAKFAAIEAIYENETCAPLVLVAFPDDQAMKNNALISIPCLSGLLTTYSTDGVLKGVKDIIEENKERVKRGIEADIALKKIRAGDQSAETRVIFDQYQGDWGYGQLLKQYVSDITQANEEQIAQAARDTVPSASILFWVFRVMVGLGFLMLLLFTLATYSVIKGNYENKNWLLRFALYSLPFPWLCVEAGWFVAEYGRQPWAVNDVLPTFLAISNLTVGQILFTMITMVALYTIFLIIEMYLMIKYARLGPSSLATGKYDFESKK